MRLLPTILAALVLIGCQATPPDYSSLTERIDAGEEVSPERLREAFLRAEDLPKRLARLNELEGQALALLDDEPLRLGSIGSAILDTYAGSLTGHLVLARFYEHVTNHKANYHRRWVERIQQAVEAAGDGSRASPYPAVTPAEAQAFAVSRGASPVGSIYQAEREDGGQFGLLLQVRPDEGPLESLVFDLTPLYRAMREDFEAKARAAQSAGQEAGEEGEEDENTGTEQQAEPRPFTPLTLIGYLAKQNDSAAQAAVGGFLLSRHQLGDAVDWLRAASRSGNVLANTLLANIFLQQARAAEDDEARRQALDQAMDNYLHAVALGSAEAMYALGVLYLNGQYGEENKVSGVPLLKQAAELGDSDATMFLAHLHYAGEVVDKDLEAARRLYVQSAAKGNEFARKSYARFLLDRETGQPGDPRAVEWLEELAREGEPESMLLLGNLHARGVGTRQSERAAVRYYKRAVEQARTDPDIVNEVAWTLAVSDQRALRRARYARRIMDHLMEANEAARQRPEYLDTWAATYAATGDFEQAVALQQQAVQVARENGHEDVLEILEQHLEAFNAGEMISEAVP